MSRTRVAISAGHFPDQPGAIATVDGGYIYVEHELAQKVISVLEQEILNLNSEIEIQTFWGTLSQKVDAINRYGADIALEVHFNDAPDMNVVGTETLYHTGSVNGKAFATEVQSSLVEKLATVNRGVKIGWYQGQVGVPLYFLKNTIMPAIIIEVCFLSAEDIEQVIGIPELPDWQNPVAEAIAAGVKAYLGVQTDTQPTTDHGGGSFTEEADDENPGANLITVHENDLIRQLARFKDYQYRASGHYLVQYPVPVKVEDRIIQGNTHAKKLDCSTFIESLIVGGFQKIFADRFTLTELQHRKLLILSDSHKPDGPIHTLTELGIGQSYTQKTDDNFKAIKAADLKTNLAWSVFQGWRNSDIGHIFIVYKSKKIANKTKHLILECNRFYNLTGVGVRNFGNLDNTNFAAIITGQVPDEFWIESDYLLATYPELYGVKLNTIFV